MSDWTFSDWMEKTEALQRDSFQVIPYTLTGKARAEFIRWNVLAAIDELTEALNETKWKPWAMRQGRIDDRQKVIDELVDVLHFVGNLFLTVGATGEEITASYEAKQSINAQRQSVDGGFNSDHKCRFCGKGLEARYTGDTCTECMNKMMMGG